MTREQLEAIVRGVDLGRALYADWQIRVLEKGDGFLLQLVYNEADVDRPGTVPVPQHARKWYVSAFSTETEIVRTCWKAVLTSLEHRLGEHFTYNGARVYSPHVDVELLREASKFPPDRRP